MPKIIDQFLDDDDFHSLASVVMSNKFYWFWNPVITSGDKHSTGQFYHQFYMCNGNCQSDFFPVLEPLLSKLGQLVLFRVKANLNLRESSHLRLGDFHTDFPGFESTTAIFYLNTNNGWTEFEGGQRVESRSNRLVLFPQELMHVGYACTDQASRFLLNINFLARV